MELTNGDYLGEKATDNYKDDLSLEKTQVSFSGMPIIFDKSTCRKANLNGNEDQNVRTEKSEMTSLLCAFRKLHEKRMLSVENLYNISEEEKNKKILHVLRQYVSQLEEQNDVLMSTMIELETEAHQRVVQMEKRLKSSAKSTMEAVINLNECEKEMRRLVFERLQIKSALDDIQNRISTLKIENNFLIDQNFNLNHDIQALLQIIQHARTTGHWEMDCVTFCEVTPEQVFGPVQSMSQLYSENVDYSPESPEINENKQKSPQRILQSCSSSNAVMEANEDFNDLQWSQEKISNELLEKEKAISNLQTKLMQIEQEQFILNGNQNELHSQRLESTKQHQYSLCKKSENLVIVDKPISINLPGSLMLIRKNLSLPSIDGFMHHENDTYKSCFYAESILSQKKYSSMMEIQYLGQIKRKRIKMEEDKGKWPCKPVHLKFDCGPNFRQVYSEPLLFIYGDSICVYKPCEPLDKGLILLTDDFGNGIPLCQSIDLKVPTEENDLNLRSCDWDHLKNPQDFPVFDRSTCMPCQRVMSKNSCSFSNSDETCCSRDLPLKAEVINLSEEEFSSVGHLDTYSRLSCVCEKNYSSKEQQHNFLISRSIQTVDKSNRSSVGTQLDFNEQVLSQDIHPRKLLLIENGYSATDIEEINQTIQKIKNNLLKTEDKVAAKEMLIEQLQNHLQTAMEQVEMKDTTLENIERKLGASRNENASLKTQIINLQDEAGKLIQDLYDAKVIQDNLQLNVEARKEQIKELREQEQILQNQKRSLMIQLDAQGDQLENARSELLVLKEDIKNYKTKVEQQTFIIKALQDAVVQSKRALDVVRQTPPLKTQVMPNNLQNQSKPIHSSKSCVVDI